jgi:hypothetical protein
LEEAREGFVKEVSQTICFVCNGVGVDPGVFVDGGEWSHYIVVVVIVLSEDPAVGASANGNL